MTRAVKWSVRAAIALALVGGIAWALRPRPIVVQTARATRGVLEATVTAEGKTRVKDLFEKRGHELVDLDVAVFLEPDRPVLSAQHRAIYRLRRSETPASST